MAKWQQSKPVNQWSQSPAVSGLKHEQPLLQEQETEESQFSPEQIGRIEFLQKQLGGRLPSQEQLTTKMTGGEFGADISNIVNRMEMQRRVAYDRLQKEYGFSPEEITGALAYEKALKPPSKLPQTIGSFGAGIVASKVIPGPADDIAIAQKLLRGTGKAVIAGLGGVAGKAVQMAADPDIEWNKKELAKVFGEETAYEAVTLGLAPIGRRLIKPIKETAIEGAEGLSKKLAARGKEMGIKTPTRFLPAQYSENQLVDTIQGIGEGSLIGSNTLYQYKRGQLKAGASLIDELSETISKGAKSRTSDDVAALLIDSVENNERALRTVTNKLYGAIDDVVGGQPVDMRKTKELVEKLKDQLAQSGNIGLSDEVSRAFRVGDVSDDVTFEIARNTRSDLLDVIRKGESKLSPDPKAARIAKQIVSSVDTATMDAAKNAGPKVEQMVRRADWVYKSGKDRFNNRTLRTLIKQLSDPALSKPEVANTIFRSKHNILRVKKAAGKEAFQKVKGAWIQNIVADSMVPDPTDIKGLGQPIGMKILKKFNGVGPDVLDLAFTPAEQNIIRENARIMAIIQAKTGGHAGALRFVQGAAAAGIVTGPLTGEEVGKDIVKGSGVLLVGPAVIGRLMAKPWFGKLLSEGYKVPTGTQQSVAITARLIRNVLQTRKEINEERDKLRKQELSRELSELRKFPRHIETGIRGSESFYNLLQENR